MVLGYGVVVGGGEEGVSGEGDSDSVGGGSGQSGAAVADDLGGCAGALAAVAARAPQRCRIPAAEVRSTCCTGGADQRTKSCPTERRDVFKAVAG